MKWLHNLALCQKQHENTKTEHKKKKQEELQQKSYISMVNRKTVSGLKLGFTDVQPLP